MYSGCYCSNAKRITPIKKKRKIIIDTDAGVDDAQALFLALDAMDHDEIDILAITTCSGNVPGKDLRN